MSLSFLNTNTTGRNASAASTHVANLASGGANELLVVAYLANDGGKHLLKPATWDGEYHSAIGGDSMLGYLYKETDGGEGATEAFTVSSTTDLVASASFRVTGHDVADPFNIDNRAEFLDAGDDVWTTSSGLLTGINNSDSNVLLLGGVEAVRSISTQDGDLTSVVSTLDGNSVHILRETGPGTSNKEYINNMSGSQTFLTLLLEIKAAGGVPTLLQMKNYMRFNGVLL